MAHLGKKLASDRHTSYKAYARQNNISESTVRRAAKSMGFMSRAVCAVPLLTSCMRENRLSRSKILLN